MKHFLLSIFCLFAFVASATTVNYTFSDLGNSNINPFNNPLKVGMVEINLAKGENTNNSPAYYSSDKTLRGYAKNTMTFTGEEDVTIEKVVFTTTSKQPFTTATTATPGTFTSSTATWEGDTNSFILTFGSTVRILSLEITYTVKEATEKPATPVVKYGDTVVSADEDVTVEEGTAFSVTSNGATSITVTPEGSEPIEITGNSGEFTPEVGEHLFTIVAHNGVGDSDSFMFTATVTERVAPEASNYKLATSTSQLKAGLKVIFVNQEAGKTISTADNNNNRKTTSIEFTDDKSALLEPSDEVLIVELGGSEDAWTFETTNYAGTNGYFASATSGSNNHLKIQESAMTAKISFAGSDATVTFNAGGDFARTIMRYNSTNNLFACYSGGQQPVQMYIYDSSTTAIDTIVVDNDAEEEYYNLQGVRVNGDVAPGLYIVKKGNEVKKVIVR